jgi:hypothetical protein
LPAPAARTNWRRTAGHAAAPAEYHFISTLDDIAWLLNLRGADVNYNPVFISHLLLSPDSATLFVDSHKVDARCRPNWQPTVCNWRTIPTPRMR